MKRTQLAQLHAEGFDRSEAYGKRWGMRAAAVACSQCQALVINGVPTHETGCPNQVFECRGCNASVPRRGMYCPECQ